MISHCGFNLHSHMSTDLEHLFICLLTMYMFSSERCLFRSFAYVLIGLFGVLAFGCVSSL